MARLFRHHPQHGHHFGRMGTRGQPEESRAAILAAAAQEFAEHGIAGARTDAIAREARVNKALIYYYFKDKETLYGAVLDEAFARAEGDVFRALDSELPLARKNSGVCGRVFRFFGRQPGVSQADAAGDDAGARGAVAAYRQADQELFPADFRARRRIAEQGNRRRRISASEPSPFYSVDGCHDCFLFQQRTHDAQDRGL